MPRLFKPEVKVKKNIEPFTIKLGIKLFQNLEVSLGYFYTMTLMLYFILVGNYEPRRELKILNFIISWNIFNIITETQVKSNAQAFLQTAKANTLIIPPLHLVLHIGLPSALATPGAHPSYTVFFEAQGFYEGEYKAASA